MKKFLGIMLAGILFLSVQSVSTMEQALEALEDDSVPSGGSNDNQNNNEQNNNQNNNNSIS